MVRPIVTLAACHLVGCLALNPAYDEASAAGSSAAVATDSDPTTAAAATTTQADTASAGTGSAATGSAGDSMASGDVSTSDTTGCTEVELQFDGDGDGYGAGDPKLVCPGEPGFVEEGGDCDDGQADINPGADEQCDPDRRDEDCDGLVNEYSADNTSCDGCALDEFGGHSYWFCPEAMGWEPARGFCAAFGTQAVGVDLPIVDDVAENEFLFTRQTTALASIEMWLGGRDVDPMAMTYTWYDGSPLAYHNWIVSDVDDGCIVMRSDTAGKWSDRACGDAYTFACESTQ